MRTFGGLADVEALLAAYAAQAAGSPRPADPPPAGLSGQTGIRMREALVTGDARAAATLALTLDEAHRIELLLGTALRDARGGWAAARLWLAAETAVGLPDADRWWPVCRLLAEPGPDHALDQLAAAYVAEGRVPEVWTAGGRPLDRDVRVPFADLPVAAALLDGVSGLALLDAFTDLPLHPAVSHYYRRGTIHALGARGLVILAASAG